MEPTLELKAVSRVALDVQTKPKFTELVNTISQYGQFAPQITVNSAEEDDNAKRWLLAMKGTEKELKALKDGALAFPKLYTAAAREAFRPIEDMLGKAINTVQGPIVKWAEKMQAIYDAQKAEEEAKGPGPVVPVSVDGEPTAVVPEVVAPQKTTKLEGGSVTMRDDIEIVIEKPIELLKAIVSTSERNAVFTPDLVTFKVAELKKIVKDSNRRSLPGCKVKAIKVPAATVTGGTAGNEKK